MEYLSKDKIVSILEHYKETSGRINIDFKYRFEDNNDLVINMESIQDALFSMDGKAIKLGVNEYIKWDNTFNSVNHLIVCINIPLIRLIDMMLWQRSGSVITKSSSNE